MEKKIPCFVCSFSYSSDVYWYLSTLSRGRIVTTLWLCQRHCEKVCKLGNCIYWHQEKFLIDSLPSPRKAPSNMTWLRMIISLISPTLPPPTFKMNVLLLQCSRCTIAKCKCKLFVIYVVINQHFTYSQVDPIPSITLSNLLCSCLLWFIVFYRLQW